MESDSEIMSQVSNSDQEMPETLKAIFARKPQPKRINASIFTKDRGVNVDSTNIEEDKVKKANAIFEKMNIFSKIPLNAKQIAPMFNEKLEKKQRLADREKDAGKAWGKMEKVELTEELKNDLKTIKFRNQIFPKRFYKNNDSDNLPKYFQIGTVVDGSGIGNIRDRLTKKQQKKTIAQQFLMDDDANKFSKRKYEKLSDKKRRMGLKKQDLVKNKQKKVKAIKKAK